VKVFANLHAIPFYLELYWVPNSFNFILCVLYLHFPFSFYLGFWASHTSFNIIVKSVIFYIWQRLQGNLYRYLPLPYLFLLCNFFRVITTNMGKLITYYELHLKFSRFQRSFPDHFQALRLVSMLFVVPHLIHLEKFGIDLILGID
jgi:hypothetical protein